MSRRSTVQRPVRPIWWVAALLLATFAVWGHYNAVQLGAQVEQLRDEITQLTRARDQLLAETAILSSRERIEKIAIEQLGLRPTERRQRRTLGIAPGSTNENTETAYAAGSER
jgi:cell division protein FtsL